jgi:hypothetical protein
VHATADAWHRPREWHREREASVESCECICQVASNVVR